MPRDYESDRDRDRERERRRPRDSYRRHDYRPEGYESDRRKERRSRDISRDELYDSDRHQQRRRRGHRATDSQGDLLPPPPPPGQRTSYARASDSEWDSPAPPRRAKRASRQTGDSTPSGSRGSAPLSLDALAKLDKVNARKAGTYDYDEVYLKEVRRKEKALEKEREREEKEERRRARELRERERAKRRAEEEKRRAYESDAVAREEARARRQRRREERERERRRGLAAGAAGVAGVAGTAAYATTDDERGGVRDSYYTTDDERRMSMGMGKRRTYTESGVDEARAKRMSYAAAEWDSPKHRGEETYSRDEYAALKERRREEERRHRTEQKKRRVVSGPLAEEGGVDDDDDEYRFMMEKRGGGYAEPSDITELDAAKKKKIKRIIIGVVSFLIILAIIIPVAVMMSKRGKEEDASASEDTSKSDGPSNSNLDKIDKASIPADKKGTIYDPFVWFDTDDFNLTYTAKTVGGLPLMGLNDSWDDDVRANDKVPKLSDKFEYGKTPIRGVNLGGWLNIEPFITPSFFEQYSARDGIVDEYTLCTKLGTDRCKLELEKHYSTFVRRKTFEEIRDAGFDHVRIPFGYWIVTTYEGDPYVKQIAWRYLLRGLEWARQNGLRINLDLHGAPGSQNGWNHSGRQGTIGWLNGTDGDLNAQRTLDIHHQLSQFFSQPRYKNIITMYGLVNEPRMVDIDTQRVLSWTSKAISQIRKDGIEAVLVFGDGFFGLDNWQGKLQDDDKLLLDVHQYVIFNIDQLSLTHTDKLNFACRAWTTQSRRSMDRTTGFGPTMCGEWSQADTDCTKYINNVNIGTRWEGTYNTGNATTSILKPQCPAKDASCSCEGANADASQYSDAYKKFLYQFSVAQMMSFEEGWGWFYWTWDTEKATQWSWKKGMKAGTLPKKVWDRQFDCPTKLEDFGKLGLDETY